jgi:zinc protease
MMPRWFGWSGLLLVVTSTGCAGGPQVQPAPTVTFRLRDFHLPSGLRVVVEEDHSAPVVGVVNVVGVGSTADPPGKEGLAHLVEHLTFRASPAAGRSFGSLLDQAGAANRNAETNFDATTYWEFGQKDSLLDLLTLEGLRIVDPLVHLDEATFATERAVVENELRYRAETNVAGSVWAKIQQTIFPADHPYARPATHQTLAGLTLADARAFTALHYRPANMTVLVIGDVRLETFEKLMQAS